jgi:hypothetical protein
MVLVHGMNRAGGKPPVEGNMGVAIADSRELGKIDRIRKILG